MNAKNTGIVSSLCALAGALVLAAPAAATELRVGARALTEFQSNPFVGLGTPDDLFSVRVGPTMRLSQRDGRFVYDISSRTEYEAFLNSGTRDLNAWEQFLNGTATVALGPNTVLSLTDIFSYQASIRFEAGAPDPAGPGGGAVDTPLNGGRRRFARNAMIANVDHAFSPRLTGNMNVSHRFIRFSDSDPDLRGDDTSLSASGALRYRVTKADQVGIGYGTTFQDFEEGAGRPPSKTLFYRPFVSWTHSFDETLAFQFSGGPTWIRSEFSKHRRVSCDLIVQTGIDPGPPPSPIFGRVPFNFSGRLENEIGNCALAVGPTTVSDLEDSESTTFFGAVGISKTWRHMQASANYRREQSTASGFGSSTTLDSIGVEYNWSLTKVWDFFSSAGFSRRESVAGFGLESRIDQWRAIASVRRKIDRYSSAALQIRYFNQDASGDFGGRDNENVSVVVRIDYGYKPFEFDLH